jgi:pimeloyl-ACP methyl ester carboxylesterase
VPALHLSTLDCYLRYWDVPGDEPVRLYLHGLGRSSSAWVPIAFHPVVVGRRTVLVDFLGFGFSDRPRDFDYTIESHAETLISLIDALAFSGCELVGHSLGGTVATVIASRRPDLVSALVLSEANLDPGGGPMAQGVVTKSEAEYVEGGYEEDLKQLNARARNDDGPVFPMVIGMQQSAAPWAIYRTARSLVDLTNPTTRQMLLDLDIPRTFLVGQWTLEADTKPASGEDGVGLDDTDVEVLVVPDAGHAMLHQNPAGVAKCIARALG